MLNGKVVSTTLLSKDTYDAMTRVVMKSNKKETTNVEANTNSNTTINDKKNQTTEKPSKPSDNSLENNKTDNTKEPINTVPKPDKINNKNP